jgi:hypothetical protein
MNYRKIYDSLIIRAKNRKIDGYKESHHIIPKCVGGSDDDINLVDLTPEEHYLAHQLLIKIHPNNYALVKAAAMMIPKRPSNKLYGWLRRRFSKAKSDEQSGSGNSQFGTMWIHNMELRESKRILKSDNIPAGWLPGRILDFDKEQKNKQKEEQKKKQRIKDKEQYTEWCKIYSEFGWVKFVEITGYNKSKPNFVQRCSVLVDNFVPQNGKRRG